MNSDNNNSSNEVGDKRKRSNDEDDNDNDEKSHKIHHPPITTSTSYNIPSVYKQPTRESFKISTGHDYSTGSYKNVLQNYIDNTTQYTDTIFMTTTNFIVIYDAYNKATIHLLVLPKHHLQLPNEIRHINSSHLLVLKEMNDIATQIANSTTINSILLPKYNMMIGFHTIPSLLPLHLHIISSDLHSDHLKTKRHYNSFTTKFFIKINDIINHLESNTNINSIIGSKEYNEGLLKSDMRCNRCSCLLNNIPNLKKHLHSCNK